MNVAQQIAQDLSLRLAQVEAALTLFSEGATIPFIARYRKEKTDELDELQLREISERSAYLKELGDRKATVLDVIEQQGALTAELKAQIETCLNKTELEDLYLPYKPKRRTRATIAKENGLEPLAMEIRRLNDQRAKISNRLSEIAAPYVNDVVKSPEAALAGASDILAEAMAERADLRSRVRQFFLTKGQFCSKIRPKYAEETTKYDMYRSYQIAVRKVAPHNLLALLRGDKEGFIRLSLDFDDSEILAYLLNSQLKTSDPQLRDFYTEMVKDGFSRLMKPSLSNEVIAEKKIWADDESIQTFAENLRNLLMSAPAGMKPTLGIDPGFRTGCKVAAIGETGQFLEFKAIYPHSGKGRRIDAHQQLLRLIETHGIELIAIGNGTASRETDQFVDEVFKDIANLPIKVMVNESGASIYSASETARSEFPDLDLTVRGAISIARRLQDPLAELVKIDPKSIGVGQYQHDVDQKRLKQKLDETVESCVNYVGVDLNTASRELLQYVSGINKTIANNIVEFRDKTGRFNNRKMLLKVSKLGPKAFEQAAGFLRIRAGENPLDNTAVHPESYKVVEAMAADLDVALSQIPQAADQLKQLPLKKYVTDGVGEPTLRDILFELEKPGRDPRAQFTYAKFAEGVHELSDLRVGMVLEGVVTNVANFGAFVDVGVHQDGLVHISQMADRFVKDPKDIVQVGQVVKVQVLEVQESLKRISLTMKLGANDSHTQLADAPKKDEVSNRPVGKPQQKTQPSAQRHRSKSGKKHPPKSRPSSQKTTSAEELAKRFNRKL